MLFSLSLAMKCLQDCTGGFVCFFMAVNAYMADVTAPEHRTKRIAFMSGLWPVGFNIGKALSGVIKDNLGFMYNFSIGMLLSLSAMLYVQVFVKDSITIRNERIKKELQEKGLFGIHAYVQMGNYLFIHLQTSVLSIGRRGLNQKYMLFLQVKALWQKVEGI